MPFPRSRQGDKREKGRSFLTERSEFEGPEAGKMLVGRKDQNADDAGIL